MENSLKGYRYDYLPSHPHFPRVVIATKSREHQQKAVVVISRICTVESRLAPEHSPFPSLKNYLLTKKKKFY